MVIRRPKSESVLDLISEGYFIDFVSLWVSFWSPQGASFGVIGSRLPVWEQFWCLKINAFWGLERTNGLRGFWGVFKVSKWSFVAMPPRVYTVFYQYKLAFANIIADLYLSKLFVWCELNANIAAPTRTPTRDTDEHCERICMQFQHRISKALCYTST